MKKKFELDVILTAGKGNMMLHDGLGRLIELGAFMTGDKDLWLHDLIHLGPKLEQEVSRQHTWLAEIDLTEANKDNFRQIYDRLVKKYGRYHEVEDTLCADHIHLPPDVSLHMAGFKGQIMGMDEDGNLIDLNEDTPED